MGAFLDKPKTEKHLESGNGNGLTFALCSMQGWRIEMEDAHCAVVGLPHGLKDWNFFAVFDGHAGARVSAHCAENLLETIVQAEDFKNCVNTDAGVITADNVDKMKRGIRDGFLALDERMKKLPEVASGEDKSGSTAVTALISPTHLFFANCGDSRGVLSRAKKAFFSTQDHKPVNPGEKERIQRAGGSVMIQRVNGSLAVSRALGDFEYKQVEGKGPCEQLVSPEPEVTVQERDIENDEFLILACDGIWDVMSNEDLCDYVRYMLHVTTDLQYICSSVIDTCLYKGSKDNMSIVLVTFPGAPKVNQDSLNNDISLNESLKKRVEDLIVSKGHVEVNEIFQIISEEDFPGLPPGGGLCAKRFVIEETYTRAYPTKTEMEEGSSSPVKC